MDCWLRCGSELFMGLEKDKYAQLVKWMTFCKGAWMLYGAFILMSTPTLKLKEMLKTNEEK